MRAAHVSLCPISVGIDRRPNTEPQYDVSVLRVFEALPPDLIRRVLHLRRGQESESGGSLGLMLRMWRVYRIQTHLLERCGRKIDVAPGDGGWK